VKSFDNLRSIERKPIIRDRLEVTETNLLLQPFLAAIAFCL
jgi:hypothetical protein